MATGPQIFPYLDYAAVLRLERNERSIWTIHRMTEDTVNPRAVVLSPDEETVYVAESGKRPGEPRQLRAYPVRDEETLGQPIVLASFDADERGVHRGIEGMCLDDAGNIVAVGGWRRAGPGPVVAVLSPDGVVRESHTVPSDLPMKCAFGGDDLDALYITTGEGLLLRVRDCGCKGAPPRHP